MNIKAIITLTNERDEELSIRIPAGSIFEAPTELGVQCVAVVDEYKFTIPPRSQRKVEVYGRCLNQKRGIPHLVQGRATPFRYAGASLDQSRIWQRVSNPTRGGAS